MNRDRLFLNDMLDACDKIQRYIEIGEAEFMSDERTQDAVIRRIEIIGEASKALSEDVKSKAPDEPWRRIGGMRDRLIHHYFGVKLELVWQVASVVLPPFRETILRLLESIEE